MTKVKIINKCIHGVPRYSTQGSAGMDLYLNIPEDSFITLRPLQRVLVPTGVFVEIPEGYEIQIRPRSGLAFKQGVTVLNAPGTIDSDYRGEIKVNLVNLSQDNECIKGGERIAQIVLSKVGFIDWEHVNEFTETKRGEGGHGSTGR